MAKNNNGVSKAAGYAGKAFGHLMVGMSYIDSRKQGRGVVSSLARVAAEEVFYSTPIGQAKMIADMAMMGYSLASESGRKNASHSSNFYGGQFGGNYNITQNGNTMRQRGLDALSRSNMNARNALGSEARSFHRGYFRD